MEEFKKDTRDRKSITFKLKLDVMKEAIKRKGWTVQQFGEHFGSDYRLLYVYTNEGNLSFKRVMYIADLLGVLPNDIIAEFDIYDSFVKLSADELEIYRQLNDELNEEHEPPINNYGVDLEELFTSIYGDKEYDDTEDTLDDVL